MSFGLKAYCAKERCHAYVVLTSNDKTGSNGFICGWRNFTERDGWNADGSLIPLDPDTSPQGLSKLSEADRRVDLYGGNNNFDAFNDVYCHHNHYDNYHHDSYDDNSYDYSFPSFSSYDYSHAYDTHHSDRANQYVSIRLGFAQTTPMAPTTPTTPTNPTCVDKGGDCKQKAALCNNAIYANLMSQVCAYTCGFCASTPVPTTPPAGTCEDKAPDCRQKAFLCNNKTYMNLMSQVCASTCGFCTSPAPPTTPPTCVDKAPDCKQKAFLCNNAAYKNLMTDVCPLTCNFC